MLNNCWLEYLLLSPRQSRSCAGPAKSGAAAEFQGLPGADVSHSSAARPFYFNRSSVSTEQMQWNHFTFSSRDKNIIAIHAQVEGGAAVGKRAILLPLRGSQALRTRTRTVLNCFTRAWSSLSASPGYTPLDQEKCPKIVMITVRSKSSNRIVRSMPSHWRARSPPNFAPQSLLC